MQTPPPTTPADRFAAILRWLTHFAVTRGLTGQLSQHLVSLIVDRIRGINQRFARIAARVAAGTYVLRRRTAAPRPRSAGPRTRPPERLPRSFGWLPPLVPEAVGSAAQLEYLFRDPEMAALLAAAPASLRRPLRSLCRMLRVSPPPILALPQKPRPPRNTPPAASEPPAPPRPPAPAHTPRPRRRWPLDRICGPPRPA